MTEKPGRDERFVVVRTYSAGVHMGYLMQHRDRYVRLREARRLWRWKGANTLNEVAQYGVDREWTRISEPVDTIELTEAIEIIPCTAEAQANLRESRWAK